MTGALLDAKAVGEMLGVRDTYVLKLAREDQIPHLRIGPKYVRFERDEIERWAESLRRGGSAR